MVPADLTDSYSATDQWKDFHVVSYDEWVGSTNDVGITNPARQLQVSSDGAVLTVRALDNQQLQAVSVYDAAGRLTARQASPSGSEAAFATSAWARGVYLVGTNLGVAKVSI